MPFNPADYEPVEERLARFWDDHPTGRIETELVSNDNGTYIIKALIWRGQANPFVQSSKPLSDEQQRELMAALQPKTVHSEWAGAVGEIRLPPPDATGYAQETSGTSVVNKTSALENCETSAIGRALANLGYAPKGRRPSREEMTKTSGGVHGRRV